MARHIKSILLAEKKNHTALAYVLTEKEMLAFTVKYLNRIYSM